MTGEGSHLLCHVKHFEPDMFWALSRSKQSSRLQESHFSPGVDSASQKSENMCPSGMTQLQMIPFGRPESQSHVTQVFAWRANARGPRFVPQWLVSLPAEMVGPRGYRPHRGGCVHR